MNKCIKTQDNIDILVFDHNFKEKISNFKVINDLKESLILDLILEQEEYCIFDIHALAHQIGTDVYDPAVLRVLKWSVETCSLKGINSVFKLNELDVFRSFIVYIGLQNYFFISNSFDQIPFDNAQNYDSTWCMALCEELLNMKSSKEIQKNLFKSVL